MITRNCFITLTLSMALFCASPAYGRDAARDLRRMVGYTIVAAAAIQTVKEGRSGGTVIVLDTGAVFEITDLLLPPLELTDVIVFAKQPSKEFIAKFGGKLPPEQLIMYRILIDNEAHDAVLLR